jgi:predicted nucleotidyltransferase
VLLLSAKHCDHNTPMSDGRVHDAAVNTLIGELLLAVREILGREFIGMYVTGSLATGDFDHASDVDVVVVIENAVTNKQFTELHALHKQLARLPLWCAEELECTYISREAIRRFDSENAVHPTLGRGEGEQLIMTTYDEGWVVQCHLLRTCGIVIAGPSPETLIEEVTPAALRTAMHGVLKTWGRWLRRSPNVLKIRGYQSYVVLSLCRILYTLQHGAVISKRNAARWASETLDRKWRALIEQALIDRDRPVGVSPDDAIQQTREFLESCKQPGTEEDYRRQ